MQNKVMTRAKEKLEPREFNNMMRDMAENAPSNCDTDTAKIIKRQQKKLSKVKSLSDSGSLELLAKIGILMNEVNREK
jgi:hypothetical protein